MGPQASKPTATKQGTVDAQLAADCLDEAWDVVVVHFAKYQQDLQHYHDQQVRSRPFKVGYLVLRRVMATKDKH
jgi:hypothetical protein